MKKNLLKLKIAIVCIATFTLVFAGCKKNNNPTILQTAPETGNYSVTINGTKYTGNVYSQSSFSANNPFTNEPALEVFLSGDNSQISFMLQNPTAGTAISCGAANENNTANIAATNATESKMYTTGNTGNIVVTLTELTTSKATGTFSGIVKDIDNLDGAGVPISDGAFSINF